ncbi:MAG: deoxyribonuclease IV [Oligosphaeraceae bacterium]|nr:deoxyribonuclease IV [Oligosphaeraceae bacterium]
MTFIVGCHLSASKGFLSMGHDALSIQANTFQFFTRNPRGGAAKAIDPEDVQAFLALAREHSFGPLLAHASYTLNGCSADPRVRTFATETMADDLQRMEYLPGNFYNFQPGSHLGQGIPEGIRLIVEMLNSIMSADLRTTVLLETMSGKGSEVGGKFEELGQILTGLKYPEKMGVCLDTCHIHDAGYDVVNDLDAVLEHFDRVIGLKLLRAIHLNDSLNAFASHKDRHACLGQGHLGLETIRRVINHPQLRQLPFYRETPNELEGYAAEIALLKQLRD